MVSNYPNSQIFDYKQMYDFPEKPKIITYPTDSLMDIINKKNDFTIFSHLIKKANYDNKLASQQADFTIFIPSDILLRKKYSEYFLNSIDKGLATQIINNSIMNRKIDQKLLQSSPVGKYPTISRSNSVEISTINNETLIEQKVKIVFFNIAASNGIIHIISDFLM